MTTAEIIQLIIETSNQYGIDPNIGVEQLRHESVGFKPYYVFGPGQSPSRAKGVAQFIDDTWRQYGKGGDPFNPYDAVPAWARYMRHMLDLFGGDYRLALAGYHAGEGDARAALNNPAGNPKTNAYVRDILAKAGKADYQTNDFNLLAINDEPASDDFLIYAMIGGGLLLALLLRR